MLLSSLAYGVAVGKIHPYDYVFIYTINELAKRQSEDNQGGKR
ncbi:MAG: hypothetical protein O9326_16665 [Microcystis sp. LE19-338.1B]|nr:hypothetical protein [Microcystis sp. LE19-338.1B]MCZ8358508.1 hypothetical protein [Microcystis sp. LE19-388.1G]